MIGVVDDSFLKGKNVAGRLLYALVAPAFTTYGYIAVVTAYLNLCSFLHEVSV